MIHLLLLAYQWWAKYYAFSGVGGVALDRWVWLGAVGIYKKIVALQQLPAFLLLVVTGWGGGVGILRPSSLQKENDLVKFT